MKPETKQFVIDQALQGVTDDRIAAIINYSAKAVRYQRRKAGIIKSAHGHIVERGKAMTKFELFVTFYLSFMTVALMQIAYRMPRK